MSVARYDDIELANMCAFLVRANWERRFEIAKDLAIWSQANTRAVNESGKRLDCVRAPSILAALDAKNFRYDRDRAIASIRQMSYNTETGDGKSPATFAGFDLERYTAAFARIMDLAFARLVDEGEAQRDMITWAHNGPANTGSTS